MFKRENTIGLLLLLFCSVSAAAMIRAIVTGQRIEVDLPPAIAWPLGIVFFGLVLYGLFGQFGGRLFGGEGRHDGPSWPDPRTGQRSLLDRIRGLFRKNDRT